jgi:hypothetical protein
MKKFAPYLIATLSTLSYGLSHAQSIDPHFHYCNSYRYDHGENAAFSALAVSLSLNHSLDSLKDDRFKRYSMYEEPYRKKSPAVAFALGFAPGFFIHGLGHYYIGEGKTGNVLLVTEALGASLACYGAITGLRKKFDEDPTTEPSGSSVFLFATGSIAFAASWIYDFIAAPIKAARLNKEHGFSMMLCPDVNEDMASINLVMQFR